MGYYEKKYSTIFKGFTALLYKERWDSRRIFLLLNRIKRLIERIKREVAVEHKVTLSLRALDKIIKDFDKAIKKGFMVDLNVIFEEDRFNQELYKKEKSFEDNVIRIINESKKAGEEGKLVIKEFKTLQLEFLKLMISVIKTVKDEEREEYRTVEAIINSSDERDHATFMAKLKFAFKTINTSVIQRWGARIEFRRIKKNISQIRFKDKSIHEILIEIENIVIDKKKVKNKIEELKSLIIKLRVLIKDNSQLIQDTFYNAYLAMKRDLYLFIQIIRLIDELIPTLDYYRKKGLMPSEPVIEKTKKILEEEKVIGEYFRVLAQGLRIIIAEEDSIWKLITEKTNEIEKL